MPFFEAKPQKDKNSIKDKNFRSVFFVMSYVYLPRLRREGVAGGGASEGRVVEGAVHRQHGLARFGVPAAADATATAPHSGACAPGT